MNYTKRFIEESFPVKEVSFYSAKEKNIRHGHISTLHIWWARRPLAASRSTAFAALVPATDYEEGNKFYDKYRKKLIAILRKDGWAQITEKSTNYELVKHFIITLCKWENSNDKDIIELARAMILDYNNGVPPKTLDPFGGGGSIPLECLRLGCETYSNDLNPVAVLIQKCTLEYPQKYGKPGYVEREVEEIENGEYVKKKKQIYVENVLLEDVKYWGNWVLEEAKKELAQFYPPDPDGSIPVGYIWARTIPCQNPGCGAEIPLMRQFWLAKKPKKKVALFPYVEGKEVKFKIVGDGYEKWPKNFDPDKATINKAIVNCPQCNSVVENIYLREQLIKKSSNRMIAVVTLNPANNEKKYRVPNEDDINSFKKAKSNLSILNSLLSKNIGLTAIPDEFIHTPNGIEYKPDGLLYNFTPVLLYGMTTWSKIFNDRQLYSILTYIKIIKEIKLKFFDEYDKEYSKSVITYLAISLSRVIDYYNTLCIWDNTQERTVHVFGRQSLSMVWDYSELNPNSDTVGSWESMAFRRIHKVLSSFYKSSVATVNQNSADSLSFKDDFFDAVFTDPPYYDNIPYADLSDFFYVWLKRIIGEDYSDLFTTPMTPKKNEIIAELPLLRGMRKSEAKELLKTIKTKEDFENNLKKSFQQIQRVLKPKGITIIVYAHKSTEGWETLTNSLLDSKLVISSAWPISTEQSQRLRANDSAALASSIYIVCRKIDRQPTAFYNDVKEETKNYLSKKLDRLWNEGISGADFFIAAIGSSIEVFGKYKSVIDFEGNVIRANKLLEDVRIIVTDYAVKKILHNGFATGISELTRYYVLCRWEFKAAKIPFDEANKLAHSCHIELADFWQTKSLIKKDKEFVLILGPQDREIDDLNDSGELIDVLHYAIKLWEKGKKVEMQKMLNETGYAKSDAFFRVAQAIAETLPNESKEKKLLEGFLNLRDKISESFKSEEKDKGFFDQ